MAKKAPDAFRTISEVSDWLGVSPHVLRFWESKFSQVKPVKRAGGRRYYRPADMELLGGIRKLLHEDGLTVKGVQKVLKDQGVRVVSEMSPAVEDAAGATTTPAIFRSPPLNATAPVSETVAQKDAGSLPLFSDSLAAHDAERTVTEARIADPGIAEPSAPKDRTPPIAPPEPQGLVIEPLPDLPSAEATPEHSAPEVPEAEAAPEPDAAASLPPKEPPVIAPLPEPDLPLTERLARLLPGQVPVDRLRPLRARLHVLRARMDER